MAMFITLVDFTQQGIQNFKATAERADQFKAMAQKAGVTVKELYWTMGAHDAVVILEAADDEAVTAVMLGLGSLGNVRTQTLRAFDSSEMKDIISKVPT
ncbi:MAG: GYD domain-containing protein [Planctomycetota bacterium]|jgi:uncharacterized protein with GYD domain